MASQISPCYQEVYELQLETTRRLFVFYIQGKTESPPAPWSWASPLDAYRSIVSVFKAISLTTREMKNLIRTLCKMVHEHTFDDRDQTLEGRNGLILALVDTDIQDGTSINSRVRIMNAERQRARDSEASSTYVNASTDTLDLANLTAAGQEMTPESRDTGTNADDSSSSDSESQERDDASNLDRQIDLTHVRGRKGMPRDIVKCAERILRDSSVETPHLRQLRLTIDNYKARNKAKKEKRKITKKRNLEHLRRQTTG